MTENQFKNNSSFVVGHRLRVMSIKRLKKLDHEHKWMLERAIEHSGQELITVDISDLSEIKLYTDAKSWSISLPLQYLEFTSDDRRPSEESLELCKSLISSNKIFIKGDAGEIHGSSNSEELDRSNVYPVLNPDGDSLIHIPNCGVLGDALPLKIIRELLNSGTYDASFSTGASFIRRNYHLVTKDKVKGLEFTY